MKINEIFILVNDKKIFIKQSENYFLLDKKNDLLDFLIQKIVRHNFKKIYLLCSIKNKFLFKKYHKKKIHNSIILCFNTGSDLSFLEILNIIKSKTNKDFILMNGKNFIDINFSELASFQFGKNLLHLCFIKNNNDLKKKSINLKIEKSMKINAFLKKNKLINLGLYVISKDIIKYINNQKKLLDKDIVHEIISNNKAVAKIYPGKFFNLGFINNSSDFKKYKNILLNKTLFLDRDGVINKLDGYVLNYKDFIFLPGVKKAIKYANDKNYLVIIITNQSAVGRSWLKEKKLNHIHDSMKQDLYYYKGAYVNDIFFSPYYSRSQNKNYRLHKNDRKPGNGMFVKAIKKWNIDVKKSIFIGDQVTDKHAAKLSKIKFYFKQNYSLYKQLKSII
jgi:D,D-heptose 1,7-bisphosphate phosphatase